MINVASVQLYCIRDIIESDHRRFLLYFIFIHAENHNLLPNKIDDVKKSLTRRIK